MSRQTEYADILRDVDVYFEKIQSMRPLSPAGEKYLLHEFGISATHNSNALEGNTFTFDETRYLLEKGIAIGNRTFRENQDIVGYKKGFDFLYEALKNARPITEEFIKKVHSFVLFGDEEAGRYKTVQNYVGTLTRVSYTPSAPSEVPEKMAAYVATLQADMAVNAGRMTEKPTDWNALFTSLAEHHIRFENIHPFIDGNGRTGRLLLTYEMISLGLLPIDIRYEEQKRYYAAFTAYRKKDKYSTREGSRTEKMAKLLAECERKSLQIWLETFV